MAQNRPTREGEQQNTMLREQQLIIIIYNYQYTVVVEERGEGERLFGLKPPYLLLLMPVSKLVSIEGISYCTTVLEIQNLFNTATPFFWQFQFRFFYSIIQSCIL